MSFVGAGVAHAIDVQVNASVNMKAVISATAGQDMNFGNVNFEPNHSGEIRLATNGSVQLGGGASGLTLDGGSPTAGDVTISGDGQSNIEISCESNGVLGSNGSGTLNLQDVQFSVDSGRSYGAATNCSGLSSPAAVLDLASNNAPKLFFGGALNVSGNAISASDQYSTANAGGDPVTVRVVYQ